MTYNRKTRIQLKQCRENPIQNCGLTKKAIDNLIGNPAGVGRMDAANPHYRDNIFISGRTIEINLSCALTGDQRRARAARKNIQSVYKKHQILITFTEDSNAKTCDLRIHGARLYDFAKGLRLCSCESALNIGGWAPSHKHPEWGNALLVNPFSHHTMWKLSDAHEFGHKLGLKHRRDGGLMDYPPKKGPDRRKFTESDKNRILKLYR